MAKIGIPWLVLVALCIINIALGIWKGFDVLTILAIVVIVGCLAAEFYQKKVKRNE